MKDINYAVKELKDISSIMNSDEVKERFNNVIKALKNVQAEIYEELSSFDAFSEGRDEIAGIIDGLMEKVDSVKYDIDNN